MNDFYRIEDIAAMSGLSVRTIRGYLAKGILRGEKADGVWRFTQEDFSVFLAQKQVRRTSRRTSPAACLIWDWPVSGGEEENRLCAALTERANALGLRWSYHYESGMARAILEGPPEAIAALLSHLT